MLPKTPPGGNGEVDEYEPSDGPQHEAFMSLMEGTQTDPRCEVDVPATRFVGCCHAAPSRIWQLFAGLHPRTLRRRGL